jgi:hypothetical protein
MGNIYFFFSNYTFARLIICIILTKFSFSSFCGSHIPFVAMLKLSFHGGQPGSLTDLKKNNTKMIHDHSSQVCFQTVQWFLKGRMLK